MRSVIAANVIGFLALLGFAGAASASATIDLIWENSGTDTTSSVASSNNLTLNVVLTAGANGSWGGLVSVDYSNLVGHFAVIRFQSLPGGPLPLGLDVEVDTGSRIEGIGAIGISPSLGTGLLAGQSWIIGTVTFHNTTGETGVFTVTSDADGASDSVADLVGIDITNTTAFNSATAVVLEARTRIEVYNTDLAPGAQFVKDLKHDYRR